MHLLDTDVVWALASDADGDAPVAAWAAASARTTLFVSALTLGELGAAAARLEKRDKAAAAAIRDWLANQVVAAFDGRILAMDAAVARRAPDLGLPTLRDAMLAATALEHGLTLATRDTATFRPSRIKMVDPWRYAAASTEDGGDWREATRGGPLWLKNLFVRG